MNRELIIIQDYCDKCHVDPQFIIDLNDDGLIEVQEVENEKYISADQLNELERYQHLFYDLDINVHGIDAIHHMLQRIQEMQNEIFILKNQISFLNR